jgi:membrane-bound metal-dependent hydrolase YbcI (DUF457 family)
MDPISHVIFGGAIIAAVETPDRARFGRGAAAAGVLGALAPDIDCVLMPIGWDIYLRFHEVATHSVAGAVVLGSAAAVLVRSVVKGAHLRALIVVASLGAISHIVFDVLSGARIAVGWPVTNARIAWPLVAMAEPWVLLLLGAGGAMLLAAGRRVPQLARCLLLALTVFFGIKGTLYADVQRLVEPNRGVGSRAQTIEARWGSWTEWLVSEKDPNAVRTWLVDGWNGTRELVLSQPLSPEAGLVLASRSLDTVRNFLRVHDLTFAIERVEDDGHRAVLWSDVRYCSRPQSAHGGVDCGLWFGGTFGPDGRPLNQVVHVGGWIQTRPVAQ